MSTEIEKPKAVVLLRDGKNEQWAPFYRSMNLLAQMEIIEVAESIDSKKLDDAEIIFCDWHCFKFSKENPTKKFVLLFLESDPPPQHEVDISALNLSNFEEADIHRILTVLLLPKRLTGVTTLLEKGSMLYGEKLQSAKNIGACLDKLSAHLQRINGFKLSKRVLEFRQALLAPTIISLENMRSDDFPFTEFQVGANSQKIIVNIRFPIKSEGAQTLINEIKQSSNIHWRQIRESADIKIAIFHSQHRELELLMGWYSPIEKGKSLSSFLWKEVARSPKREDLTKNIDDYKFQLINDIKIQEDEDKIDLQLSNEFLDISALPEKIVRLLEKLKTTNLKFEGELERYKESEREAKKQIIQLQKISADKENLASSASKNLEIQTKNLKIKILELESQIAHIKDQTKINHQQQNELNADKNSKNDTAVKLEQTIRLLENERNQTHEKYLNEQKKLGIFEQKYNNVFKDSMKKDKEIIDFKSEILKLKKEIEQTAKSEIETKGATSTGDAGGSAKIKDLESKEVKLKQELKKALFKIESHEKSTKAQQQEFTDKLKLMEQKLQSAKTKEIELLKKIEDLSASLKKANKAA